VVSPFDGVIDIRDAYDTVKNLEKGNSITGNDLAAIRKSYGRHICA
jgi:hypothetical protein